mgnify:CR=1 FL=1
MDCIFCKIIKGEIPSKVLYEDELVKVIMDVNPTVDGHALIIPKKHYTDYLELDQDIITHIWDVAKKMGPSIMDKLKAKSLTLLVNFGDDQQVKHFHMHLLPNFGTMESKATKTSEEIFSILKD